MYKRQILGGGGFFSKLTTEIREKRGLVYSVYSYLYRYDKYNFFSGGAETSNENVDKVIKINPNHVYSHNNKGYALQKLKKIEASIESFYNVLKINPISLDSGIEKFAQYLNVI